MCPPRRIVLYFSVFYIFVKIGNERIFFGRRSVEGLLLLNYDLRLLPKYSGYDSVVEVR